jgi:hypothetical protein
MKKTIFQIITAMVLGLSFSSCEKDNMPGPDAKVFGKIIDKATGQLVETELVNGSRIEAFELGYPTQVSQVWLIKNNGEYRNNLVFAANYDFQLRNSNFFPVSLLNYNIKSGDNQLDFQVDPYIRVKNPQITYNAGAKTVTATFSLEAGQPAVKVRAVRLYAFTDMFVGENVKFNTAGSAFTQSYTPSKTIDNGIVTLTIDIAANAALFPAGRDYFFRIGALADIAGVGTVRHNFSPYAKITL